MDWDPIILTLKLALISTLLLALLAIPLAYWLSKGRNKIKAVVESLVSLPLVLPPTVIGFYLLLVFSPNQGLGKFLLDTFGLKLAFSFEGLVLASVIYSLPFMVYPILSGLTSLAPSLSEAALLMGKSKLNILLHVLLPNIKTALFKAFVLTFAHTIGEFGVVLMIGGNIPNETKVASIAIYDEVEALNYPAANQYALLLFTLSFGILLFVHLYQVKKNQQLL